MLSGLQGLKVVLQENLEIPIIKLLQAPFRPEERLEVIQRSIGCLHHKGVAACQALLEKTVHVSIPTSLQFAQCFNVQHLGSLVGELSDLVADRLR
ncbi:hypothetical protein D3C72_1992100 [compost metagenome]